MRDSLYLELIVFMSTNLLFFLYVPNNLMKKKKLRTKIPIQDVFEER